MAIDTAKSLSATSKSGEKGLGVNEIAAAILAPLASLKLTVFLLVLGVVVTFIATLDQAVYDIWEVKRKHFENVFVEVPFQTFFVMRWFPDMQNVPGSFYIPSGITILVLMLFNLTAAHVLRFRLQASGMRLVLGLVLGAFASLITWAIIFNGQNPDGFQAEPPISWTKMWIVLQIAVLAIGCVSAFACVTLDKSRSIERVLLGVSAALCAAVLVISLLLGEKAFIGVSAMRILWQLAQATIAAVISLVACMMLFKRKAGIVLLHLGIAGLMFNEIYVTATNEEHRMTIVEGETVSHAVDVRATEMAIIDVSDPEYDNIVVVPGTLLKAGEEVSHSELPFDVTCVRYMSNSDIRRIPPMVPDPENLASEGIGLKAKAIDLPITSGTASEQTVDFASAYVEIKDKKSGESLGTHLISQNLDVKSADSIPVGGKDYRIDLRFKTDYKPFSMKLVDVQAEYYLATQTPKWFSSDVILNDLENGTESEQQIWMNNPLRYSNDTFYQSSLGTLTNGDQYTVLQVVKNKGWMIPYVCCMFTVVGLFAQFGSSLLKYLEKNRAKEEAAAEKAATALAESGDDSPRKSSWKVRAPAIILTAVFGLYLAGELAKAQFSKVKNGEMRLDLFGQLPITKDGRVQPLDSFARNTARQLSKREEVFDGNEEKQPAIRWLADTIFEVDGYQDYRAFRIEDPTILSALSLPLTFIGERDENRYRYSLEELLEAEPKLMELIPDSDKVKPESWTVFQKRLSEVATKLQRVYGAKLTFGSPVDPADEPLMEHLEKAGKSISSPLIPLIVPSDDADAPWTSFITLQNELWLQDLGKKYGVDSTDRLSAKILDDEVFPVIKDQLLKRRIIQRFLADDKVRKVIEDANRESGRALDEQSLVQGMLENWDGMPKEILEEMLKTEGPIVDAMLVDQRGQYERVMAEQLAKVNGGEGKIEAVNSELSAMLLKLRPAYVSGDAETFNNTLTEYLAAVSANPPAEMKPWRLSLEKTYNVFSPFYLAMAMYLVACLVAMVAWIGWPESWNKAAMWLLGLGAAVHLFGLVLRVCISGRPPITNLYSSVLFVSLFFVIVLMAVERLTKLGIGNVMAGVGGFCALLWAWSMTIVDGDTFTVLVAVLDTQFWLSTHVVCISVGYVMTLVAGALGLAYVIAGLVTPVFAKDIRRVFANVIYGIVCFGLLTSFFGTVLGGLWADDSWGRFWGWDPKENGALMIVLWNAVLLHARWGGMVRERGLAALAIIGNLITLWSWKGVNALGVGLHAYAASEDQAMKMILIAAAAHVAILGLALIPTRFWMSYAKNT